MDVPTPNRHVAAVRHFNRFYTRLIGVLEEGQAASSHSLTELRVFYELAHRDDPVAADLASDLGIDAGYLSRIINKFARAGLVAKVASATDGRRQRLRLTEDGHAAFAPLERATERQIAALIAPLDAAGQERLVAAMATIEALLGPGRPQAPYVLRPHRPGDMGWVVHRQAVLYAREYGWDDTFEALVAEIAAKFITDLDPKRERCWIAERDGEILGAVFVVAASDEEAKLRLLYVEPEARGLGIGRRLVGECVRFARDTGYRRLGLWTNDVLVAARRIYETAGFRLVRSEAHHSFGKDLVGEFWELEL
jgi:DNA-binding MarR family transcriptional regulator/N-acetylglutamate synthase-like GNAT family acetyltransferase